MRELDVFGEVLRHMVEGSMFHLQMVQYFSYLGLAGFARLHQDRFLAENRTMAELQRYVVETLGMVPVSGEVTATSYIPEEWMDNHREMLAYTVTEDYVRYGMETWESWEQKTLDLYNRCYYALDDLRNGAGAEKIMRLLTDTRSELTFASNLVCFLRNAEYERVTVMCMDRDICKKYKKFMRKEEKER